MKVGVQFADVEDFPGVWSAWSKAAQSVSAWFLVPVDDKARATGVKYLTATVAPGAHNVKPQVRAVLEVVKR